MQALKRLRRMLTYKRPHGSRAEGTFILTFLLPLPGAEWDTWGNIHVRVPRADGSPSEVLWSCHTDTVHNNDGRQTVAYNPRKGRLYLPKGEKANCLGADDTVGVWLACEMIKARVPGHYVFHYGEEVGGIGSRAVTTHEPERFAGIRYAIALDRAGTSDVITHQSGGRCCSDAFAASLAEILSSVADYASCSGGVYTDTAEYTDIVAECSNISVGYYRQHGAREYVDTRHAIALRAALLTFDESRLVCERTPGEPDPDESRMLRWFRDNRPEWETEIDWREWDTTEPVALRGLSSAELDAAWDYGPFDHDTLSADDKAWLRDHGYARKLRRM